MPRRDTLTRHAGGRPTSLTPRTATVIEGMLRAGNHVNTACHAAGIDVTTFYRWMRRAERADHAVEHGEAYDRDDDKFRQFRQSVLRARGEATETMVDVVFRASLGGQLVEEEAQVDSKGDPIRDADGNPIIKRKWTTPDGRLALSYLKVAFPAEWGGAPNRLELSGPGGGPIAVNASGEPEPDDMARLAARVSAAKERQRAQEAARLAHNEQRALEAAARDADIQDAEIVSETPDAQETP